MEIREAIRQRHSVRAFRDEPVSRETLTALLEVARWSPSGVNSQPWRVEVVTGASLRRLVAALVAACGEEAPVTPDYSYYPAAPLEPFDSRRRACGQGLHETLGIRRDDAVARREAWLANFRFFDAPAALLLFMDRRLGQGAWIDLGMFWQSLMLAALAFGLGSCAQASIASQPQLMRRHVGLGEENLFLGALAVGYPDPDAAINRFRPGREEVAGFARFHHE
ncbi:MAG: nitroreductase [Magnetococcales bacterium]|nr:nitroreductase [Magnetococcales bacterium]MBF0156255.1 nitroreductase [Magnetococcales bacterium]